VKAKAKTEAKGKEREKAASKERKLRKKALQARREMSPPIHHRLAIL
jgi:hypothetical protein